MSVVKYRIIYTMDISTANMSIHEEHANNTFTKRKKLTIWMNLRAGTAQRPRSEVTTSFISAILDSIHTENPENSGSSPSGTRPKQTNSFFFFKKKKGNRSKQRRLSPWFAHLMLNHREKFLLTTQNPHASLKTKPKTNTEKRRVYSFNKFLTNALAIT